MCFISFTVKRVISLFVLYGSPQTVHSLKNKSKFSVCDGLQVQPYLEICNEPLLDLNANYIKKKKSLHGNDCGKIKYSTPTPFEALSGLEEAGSYSGETSCRSNSKSARFVKCFIFCFDI